MPLISSLSLSPKVTAFEVHERFVLFSLQYEIHVNQIVKGATFKGNCNGPPLPIALTNELQSI